MPRKDMRVLAIEYNELGEVGQQLGRLWAEKPTAGGEWVACATSHIIRTQDPGPLPPASGLLPHSPSLSLSFWLPSKANVPGQDHEFLTRTMVLGYFFWISVSVSVSV